MPNIIQRQPFKRGDTVIFRYVFQPPYNGYSWSGVTIDCALTNVPNPKDNAGALAVRIGQSLSIDQDNVASYDFALTEAESKGLKPGAKYYDECQLRQGDRVVTPITGVSIVEQDYVI